jgi:type I restriction enzyme S subunit
MKHNWTYKKLGELVNIRTGKLDANAANEGGQYPFFTCSREPLRINTFSYDCECVLVAGNGELNVKYYNGKFDAYQRTYIIEKKPEVDYISTYYIYLFFQKYIDVLRSGSIGGIIKYIKLGDLTNAVIPIPAKDDQQAIVRELDGINHLIDLQEEQLREYDRLAQSLFYTTFGDPATNPKGWEVKSLGDIAEPITGITYSPDDVADDGIIVLRSSNIQDNKLDFDDIVRVRKNVAEKYYVQAGDILMCSRNGSFRLVGKTALVDNLSEKMTWGAFMTIIRSDYNPYLLQYFRTPAFREQLTTAKTTTVNQITIGMLKKLQLPIPPTNLQQSFAAQIEAIEQQKALIRKSLDDTRTLLAARMQYYFE